MIVSVLLGFYFLLLKIVIISSLHHQGLSLSTSSRQRHITKTDSIMKHLRFYLGLTLFGVATCLPYGGHPRENGLSDVFMGNCRDNEEDRKMFHEKVDQMQQCYGTMVHWNNGVNNGIAGVIPDPAASLSKESDCSLMTTYLECVTDFLGSVQHCFSPNEQSFMQATINGTRAMFDAICPVIQKARSEVVSLFSTARCLKDSIPELYACTGESGTEQKVLKDDNLALGLLRISYDEENCNGLKEAWTCAKRVLDRCQPSAIIQGIEEGVEKFEEATPCKEILRKAGGEDTTQSEVEPSTQLSTSPSREQSTSQTTTPEDLSITQSSTSNSEQSTTETTTSSREQSTTETTTSYTQQSTTSNREQSITESTTSRTDQSTISSRDQSTAESAIPNNEQAETLSSTEITTESMPIM